MAKCTKIYIICVTLLISSQHLNSELVMESKIYNQIVEAVHNVFNNTCMIYMYTIENPMQALGKLSLIRSDLFYCRYKYVL